MWEGGPHQENVHTVYLWVSLVQTVWGRKNSKSNTAIGEMIEHTEQLAKGRLATLLMLRAIPGSRRLSYTHSPLIPGGPPPNYPDTNAGCLIPMLHSGDW